MRAVADLRARRPSSAAPGSALAVADPTLGSGNTMREDVIQVSMALGMDPYADQALMWIPERALNDPLPGHWTRV
jgi:phage terminase small subunit